MAGNSPHSEQSFRNHLSSIPWLLTSVNPWYIHTKGTVNALKVKKKESETEQVCHQDVDTYVNTCLLSFAEFIIDKCECVRCPDGYYWYMQNGLPKCDRCSDACSGNFYT